MGIFSRGVSHSSYLLVICHIVIRYLFSAIAFVNVPYIMDTIFLADFIRDIWKTKKTILRLRDKKKRAP